MGHRMVKDGAQKGLKEIQLNKNVYMLFNSATTLLYLLWPKDMHNF